MFPPVCTLNFNNWQHPTLVITPRWWFPCSPIPPLPPRHLGSQLAELERAIEKMMEADFVKFAMEDIQQRLQYAQEMATPHSNPERTDSEVWPYCYWHCIYVCCYPVLTRMYCSILCYTVIYCGILWYTVIYCGILWYTVVYCGILWYTVVHCGILWYTMVYNVVYCGILRYTVVY